MEYLVSNSSTGASDTKLKGLPALARTTLLSQGRSTKQVRKLEANQALLANGLFVQLCNSAVSYYCLFMFI